MKPLFTLLLSLMFLGAKAQIVNPDFENWMNGNPVGWVTSLDSLPGSVVQSDSAYNGSSALQLNVVHEKSDTNKYAGGFAYTDNTTGSGTPDPDVPQAILGWYKLTSVDNDLITISANVYSGGYVVGSSSFQIGPSSVYKQFEADVDYTGTFATIDYYNVSFMFAANNANDSLHKGTTFTVDDLSVGLASGVENLSGNGAGLEAIYPNPSHNRADIIYNVATFSKVSLTVYDALGRGREVLLNQEQTSGKYRANLNTDGLSPGVYFARLLINGDSYNTPFLIN